MRLGRAVILLILFECTLTAIGLLGLPGAGFDAAFAEKASLFLFLFQSLGPATPIVMSLLETGSFGSAQVWFALVLLFLSALPLLFLCARAVLNSRGSVAKSVLGSIVIWSAVGEMAACAAVI
jgi:hypothetical protein